MDSAEINGFKKLSIYYNNSYCQYMDDIKIHCIQYL